MTKKIRWGIMSTANIGVTKVIPALQKSKYNEVIAISSRSIEPAQNWADKLVIPKAYASYEALLADPDIDAIYNPLPNHLHIPLSMAAVEAGKHVLCEKPLGLHAADIQPLISLAKKNPRLKVMEAFMYPYHPQWVKIRQLINDNAIGKLRNIHSHFYYNNRDELNIRNRADWGGGALLDIGCYPISSSRLLYGRDPIRVFAQITPWPGQEVDCLVTGMMDFGDATASFSVSTKIENGQGLLVSGESGSIQLNRPFTPDMDSQIISLQQDQQLNSILIEAANQYSEMGDAFALSILNDTAVPAPLTSALAHMRIIDAMFLSAAENKWINL